MFCLPKHDIFSYFLHISGRGQGRICEMCRKFCLILQIFCIYIGKLVYQEIICGVFLGNLFWKQYFVRRRFCTMTSNKLSFELNIANFVQLPVLESLQLYNHATAQCVGRAYKSQYNSDWVKPPTVIDLSVYMTVLFGIFAISECTIMVCYNIHLTYNIISH